MNGALIGGVVDTPETTKAGVSHCLQRAAGCCIVPSLPPINIITITTDAQPPRRSTNPTASTTTAWTTPR